MGILSRYEAGTKQAHYDDCFVQSRNPDLYSAKRPPARGFQKLEPTSGFIPALADPTWNDCRSLIFPHFGDHGVLLATRQVEGGACTSFYVKRFYLRRLTTAGRMRRPVLRDLKNGPRFAMQPKNQKWIAPRRNRSEYSLDARPWSAGLHRAAICSQSRHWWSRKSAVTQRLSQTGPPLGDVGLNVSNSLVC